MHGCLGRWLTLRSTGGARVAIEGTWERVIVAAKPRHALSSLTRPQGVVGAVSGLAPEIERKLTSMEGALGRGRGGPSRGFRTKRSWIRRQIVRSLARVSREAGDSRRIDRGVRGSVGQAARGRKRLVISTAPTRLSPLSRRETRCGSVARPKGRPVKKEAHKSGSKHVSLKVICCEARPH